jgi:hypothetical protein
MDSPDVVRVSRKAKRETEAFINNYINDQAKGWPRVRTCTAVYAGYRQGKNDKRADIE